MIQISESDINAVCGQLERTRRKLEAAGHDGKIPDMAALEKESVSALEAARRIMQEIAKRCKAKGLGTSEILTMANGTAKIMTLAAECQKAAYRAAERFP